jgi:fructose-specific PTS system IIA-like component
MPIEYQFTCTLRNGLHARPASILSETARAFRAAITLRKAVGSSTADARSVLSLVALDATLGDQLILAAEGDDAASAMKTLRETIESRLAEGDEVLAPSSQPASSLTPLPRGLRDAKGVCGRSACSGIGAGIALVINGLSLPESAMNARPESVESELAAAARAVTQVRSTLQARAGTAIAKTEREVLKAHAEIADDPALVGHINARILSGRTAPQAIFDAAAEFSSKLRCAASDYIRERVIDVHDVCMQLIGSLLGDAAAGLSHTLTHDSVVIADSLTANQLLGLDHTRLKALVLGSIGATSHTVILARSMGIPTVINLNDVARLAAPGDRVLVDGNSGWVFVRPDQPTERYFERKQRTHAELTRRATPLAASVASTIDGVQLEVGANAAGPRDAAVAFKNGADGIGLLRTELMFLEREAAPDEAEQFEAYAEIARTAAGKPVIIRTFDIGGDKPATYMNLPKEENPFLGVRGLRLYAKYPAMIRSQLRAIVRASAFGKLKVMAPMVSTVEEAIAFKRDVRDVQNELHNQGVAFDASMPVGVMVEVPSVALIMDELCDEVDFFSIGSNDLLQYSMAVDRGNAGVASLYSSRQPSFIRLLKIIVDRAKAKGRWIGVCGEMAGDEINLPLLVGLGIDEISVAPGDILKLKSAVAQADAAKCRSLFTAAAAKRSVELVESCLREGPWRGETARGIVSEDLINLTSDACSKDEAIRDAVDLLTLSGRTTRPEAVEEAIWAREATYSTGLGYGCAIPHCKTDALSSPALVAVRLGSPVEWGSSDGQPVRMVLALIVPSSDSAGTHMKIFAKLARRLMHDEFRDRLTASGDAAELATFLRSELGIESLAV